MNFISQLFGVLIRPVRTTRLMLINMPLNVPLIVFGGFCVSLYSARFLQNMELLRTRPSSLLYLAPLELLLILIGLFGSASVLHMTADFLGGGGRGSTLFRMILLDTLPLWLLGPFTYLINKIPALSLIGTVVSSLIIAWFLGLVVVSIKEIYRFTIGRAMATLLIPLVILSLGFLATYLFLDVYGLDYFKDLIRFLIG